MLEAYLIFNGRIRRLPYFLYSILLGIILGLMVLLAIPAIYNARYPFLASLFVCLVLAVLWLWAHAALGVKCCHDLEKSGWLYVWIVLVPGLLSATVSIHVPGIMDLEWGGSIIGALAGLVASCGSLYLLFARGTDGPNKFGYPP